MKDSTYCSDDDCKPENKPSRECFNIIDFDSSKFLDCLFYKALNEFYKCDKPFECIDLINIANAARNLSNQILVGQTFDERSGLLP